MVEIAATPGDEPTEVVVHDRHGMLGGVELSVGDAWFEGGGRVAHEDSELVTVRRWDADELAEDRDA